MKNDTSDIKGKSTEPPAPEVLKAQTDDETPVPKETVAVGAPKSNLKLRHGTYRPSHKATFISLAVVVVILAINTGVIAYLMSTQNQTATDKGNKDVTISSDVLNSLGVSKNPVGSAGTELTVNPNASFNGKLKVGGDVNVAGQLSLNGKLTATDVSMGKLQAGDTSLSKVNINGDATVTNLNLRNNLIVTGSTQLQGSVIVGQLMTVNNNMNVVGNLAIGGTLAMGAFQTNTLTIGGHITTLGSAPSASKGSGLGAVDTISISGNDVAGTVAVNIGSISRSGIMADVSFINSYSNIPHVVITAIGSGAEGVYVNRTANGFSIGVSSLATGGHAFDYIVMQ